MSDPGVVRFVETMPQRAAGPALQQAVLGTNHVLAEEYRFLASRVASLSASRFTVVGIVSAVAGEGKTTVALGLAAALSRSCPQRVLLLEADLRQPRVEAYLGLPRVDGLSEWLRGEASSLPLRTLSPPGFSLISAGLEPLPSPELIGSERMASLVDACRSRFGFVVVDCPPLTPVADDAALQDMLDGFLLVVRARMAPRDVVQHAVGRLKDGRIRGVVFTDAPEFFPGPYRSYRSYRSYRHQRHEHAARSR